MQTKIEVKNELAKNFAKREILNHFIYLYDRWQDEKMYEDWNDYVISMKSCLERNGNPQGFLENVKGTKRPFGLKFTYKGFEFKIQLTFKNKYVNLRLI